MRFLKADVKLEGKYMLKIVETNTENTAAQPAQQGWALARTSQKETWRALAVPFTIGSHPDNDIYVNAPTMRALSKIVVVSEGQMIAIDSQTHEQSSLQDLLIFGIECLGPFKDNPENLSGLSRNLNLFLNKENFHYHGTYPKLLKKYLPKSQNLRLPVMAAAALFSVLTFTSVNFAPEEIQDLSATPLPVAMGNIVSVNVGAQKPTDPYANGVSFVIPVADAIAPSDQYVLTLSLQGLDLANELTVSLNDRVIAEPSAQQQCIDTVCAREIPVSVDQMIVGSNVLKIKHNAPQSSYKIQSVFFRKMEAATDEEKELANQLLSSSERYFEERHLMVKNIKNAKDAVEEAENILSTRTGLDSLKSKLTITKKKVNDAFEETSKDLRFKFQKELKLGRNRPAITLLEDLIKLYPDPASKQNLMLNAQLKKLQETTK